MVINSFAFRLKMGMHAGKGSRLAYSKYYYLLEREDNKKIGDLQLKKMSQCNIKYFGKPGSQKLL